MRKYIFLIGLLFLAGCAPKDIDQQIANGWETSNVTEDYFVLENSEYSFEFDEPSTMHKRFMQAAAVQTLEKGYTHFSYLIDKNRPAFLAPANFIANVRCYRGKQTEDCIDAAEFLKRYPLEKKVDQGV